jgi:hypothetical protein
MTRTKQSDQPLMRLTLEAQVKSYLINSIS